MKEKAISKIRKLGTTGKIISTIALVILAIGLAAVILAQIVVAVLPNELFSFDVNSTVQVTVDPTVLGVPADSIGELSLADTLDNGSLSIDGNTFVFGSIKAEDGKIIADGAAAMTHITMRRLTGTLIVALITVAMGLVTVVFIRSLCKAVERCASPFEDNVIRKMTALAYALIPWCIISSLSSSVFTSVFSDKVNINLDINLGMVFVVLVVLALAYIFKYGAMLQRESDETI